MKFNMDKGYWSNKPMRIQLEGLAEHFDFPANEGVLSPIDMKGLVKAGVRFPEIEKHFRDQDRLARYRKFIDECRNI